jgi:hypothetical protein
LAGAISNAKVVVSCGSEGIEILPERTWRKCSRIRLLADINAVPPYGIGGVKPNDDVVEREGKLLLGAIAIGGLKMRLHRKLVEELFQRNDGVYDLFEIYALKL